MYVVWGAADYAREALDSARSVRAHMPDIPIYLKVAERKLLEGLDTSAFERVEIVEDAPAGPIVKALFLDGLVEDQLLYLDVDTRICDDLAPAFALLDRFDVAAAHAPIRTCVPGEMPDIPAAFTELNGGVIFVRNTPAVRAALSEWRRLYDELRPLSRQDQPSLRKALWQSDLSIYVMPPEWNARLVFPIYLAEPVRILHSRFPDMPAAERKANRDTGQRIFHPPAFLPFGQGLKWRIIRFVVRHRLTGLRKFWPRRREAS
ncbi:putative nucleotide-diphospho-sugar transferase [Sphingomonas sp.]|uniref:putative nucleotide-diphospho-sugar transferase n=1 Tax=Sphingomonas sp. TaxID=28214 RepID=UPI0025F47B6A|nr:putative nucleotide-diphospho-sugar transferase [Sphingomonas sp.]